MRMRLLAALADTYNPNGLVDELVAQVAAEDGWAVEAGRAVTADTIREADVVLAMMVPVPADALLAATRLRLVQTASRGYDGVAADTAAKLGVPVCNVLAQGHAATVAEHTFALLLAVAKRIVEGDRAITSGRWPTAELIAAGLGEIGGKTLGIVGLGEIGKEVARRAHAFGMEMIYADEIRTPELEERYGMAYVDLATLLRVADVVTLHVPLTDATHRLIERRELASMKRGAILLNTSRGGVVDLDAVTDAARAGHLRVGLDVFEPEPPRNHPVLSAPNIVRSPHVGGVTIEALRRVVEDALANIRRLERGEPLLNIVNGVKP
jgi:phosphoglycerate dehydrogenase-like enzyme